MKAIQKFQRGEKIKTICMPFKKSQESIKRNKYKNILINYHMSSSQHYSVLNFTETKLNLLNFIGKKV